MAKAEGRRGTKVHRATKVFSQRYGAGESWGAALRLRVTLFPSHVSLRTVRPLGSDATTGTLRLAPEDFREVALAMARWQLNKPKLAWVNVGPATQVWYSAPPRPGPRTLFLETGRTGRADRDELLFQSLATPTARSLPGLVFSRELRFGTGDAFAFVAELPKHTLVLARHHFGLFERSVLSESDLGRLSFLGRDNPAEAFAHGVVGSAADVMTLLAAAGVQVGQLPEATPEQRRDWLGEWVSEGA